MDPIPAPINLKPNKPDSFDGKRDFLVVNTWLYQVEQYLTLAELSTPGTVLSDDTKIRYTSTFMTGTAAVWWFTRVQGDTVPRNWTQFKDAIIQEFVPADHIRRSREKLRKLHQSTSVAKYLSDFRNIALTIPNMTDGEKWDKFCTGLKFDVKIEVMKSAVTEFEEAAKIALRVDGALWAAGEQVRINKSVSSMPTSGATPMEIGNTESHSALREGHNPRFNREKHLQENRCFKCHKIGCRPWKHAPRAALNNTNLSGNSEVIEERCESDSEN